MDNLEIPWFNLNGEERKKENYIRDLIKNGDPNVVLDKSMNGHSEDFEEGLEKHKKSDIAQIMLTVIALGVSLIMLYTSIPKHISDKQANEYMQTTIISSLEQNDVDYIHAEKGIDITETNVEKIKNFNTSLREKGFETNEILYGAKEVLGPEDADLLAKSYGYDGLSDYIDKKYDFDGSNGISEEKQFKTSKYGYKENIEYLIEKDEIKRGVK